MRPFIVAVTLFIAALLTAECAPANRPPAITVAGVPAILFAEGKLWIRRPGWTDFFPATSGIRVEPGVEVQPGNGTRAIVLCSNFISQQLPSDITSQLAGNCAAGPKLLPDAGLGPMLGSNPTGIPYVISPRRTRLFSSTPLLRWHAAEGASFYTACLRPIGDQCIWKTQTAGTQIRYPGDPPLLPGKAYILEITTDNRRTSAEDVAPNIEFQVIQPGEREYIDAAVALLQSAPLADAERIFAIAQFYAAQELRSDALEAIDELERTDVSLPRLSLLAGDLYRQSSLPIEAADAYVQAAELAASPALEDAEAAAQARMALGAVYVELGDVETAIAAYQAARELFTRLGDNAGVTKVNEELKQLE